MNKPAAVSKVWRRSRTSHSCSGSAAVGLCVALSATLSPAPTALGDPTATHTDETNQKTNQNKPTNQTNQKNATKASPPVGEPDPRSSDSPSARAKTPPLRQLDLFPKTVFALDGSALLFHEQRAGASKEKSKALGLSLGDDGDWRVQAAQIGVMTGLFTALVALCNGGKCLLRGDDGPSGPAPRDGEVLRQDRKTSW